MPTPTNYSANLVFGGRVDSTLDKAVQQIQSQLKGIQKDTAMFSENIAAIGTGILAIGTAFLGLRAGLDALEDLADAGKNLSDITNQVQVNIGKMVSWGGRTREFEDQLSSFNSELRKTSIYATEISESFESGLTGAGFKNVSQIEFLTKRFELLAASQNRKLTAEDANAAAQNLATAVKQGGEGGESALEAMGLRLSWADRVRYRAIQNYPGMQGQAYDARERFIENLLKQQSPEGAFSAAGRNPYLSGYRLGEEQTEFTQRLGVGINNMFAPVQDAITRALQNLEKNGEIEKFTAWSLQAGKNIADFFQRIIEPKVPGALEQLTNWFDKLGPKIDAFATKLSIIADRFDKIAGPIGAVIGFLNKWDDVLFGKIAPFFFSGGNIIKSTLPEGVEEMKPLQGYGIPGGGSTPLGSGGIYHDELYQKSIPHFATGGVVTSPTLAMVGEVPEVITPLSLFGSDSRDLTRANTEATKKSTDALSTLTQTLQDNLSFLQQQGQIQTLGQLGQLGQIQPLGKISGQVPIGTRTPTALESGKSVPGFPGASRAESYGPIEGEYNHAANFYGNYQLGSKDIAASPDLVRKFGFGSVVDAVDQKGNVVNPGLTIHDYSYKAPGVPNVNTFEMRNMHDRGYLKLVPHKKTSDDSDTSKSTSKTSTPTIHYSPNVTVNVHGAHDHNTVKNAVVDALSESHGHVRRILQEMYRDEQRTSYA